MDKEYKKRLLIQQYRFSGEHSAVKVCGWTKNSLRDEGACYKNKFYGINSHRCVQMTPSVNFCGLGCVFCWRERKDFPYEKIDEPEEVVENSIKEHVKLLYGFGGNEKVNKEKFEEAKLPKHFAISLTGEPTSYPKINGLIEECHKRGISTFLVTNGMFPHVLKKIVPPTQLYVSVDEPDEKLFYEIDKPKAFKKDGWKRLIESLKILKELKEKTRTSIRITLVKGLNMVKPEEYAELIKIAEPHFVEIKGYMWVGSSRLRLKEENMPSHEEVKEFAEKIGKACGYRFIDEQKASRVVLYMKEDFKGRIMKF